jgi:drug/metabolite transporter (DMT)-like permease
VKLKGFIYAVISAVFFGSAGIFVKQGYDDTFSPIDLLTLQYVFAGIILFIVCLLKYRSYFKLSKELFKKLLIQSVFGNTLMTASFYLSFKYLDVSIATMLLYTYPAMVGIASFVFLKEKISRTKVISILATFLGCLLVLNILSGNLEGISLIGILLGVLSAIFYAFMNMYAATIVENLPALIVTFYTNVITLVVLLIFNFGFIGKLPLVSSQAMINSASLAVFCEIIPLTLLYGAIRYIGPISTSIISTIELPAAAILSFLFLGERLSITQFIGILIVVFSIITLKKEK